MSRTILTVAIAFATAGAANMYSQEPVNHFKHLGEKQITVTGCVVEGEKKGTYYVKDLTASGQDVPASNVGYRLDTGANKALEPHAGYRVEITGVADYGDVDKGWAEIATGGGREEVVAKNSERRTVQPREPESDEAPVATSGTTTKTEIPTYKLTVKAVKRLADRCSYKSQH
jgi:hypothetical protein